jgi:CHAT domain-containing protein
LDGTRVTPSWETDLIPLPGAGREIQAIRELAWTPTELVDGASATPEQLAAALARTTWVHFAGHTISSSAGITLALTSKGLLDLASIPVIPASIVLSACSSGRRDQEDTDLGSPESLASSFLEKGSREVIASLWDVDSGATEVFMRRFYSHLHATLDSGSALALAQEDLRRSGRFSHPYYWAGFTRFVRE